MEARAALKEHRDECPGSPPWYDSPVPNQPEVESPPEPPPPEVPADSEKSTEWPIGGIDGEEGVPGESPAGEEAPSEDSEPILDEATEVLESLPAIECFGHHNPEEEACFECLVAKDCAINSTEAPQV
jgi:hypothetical protein